MSADQRPSAASVLRKELGTWFDCDLAEDECDDLAVTLLDALRRAGYTLMKPLDESKEDWDWVQPEPPVSSDSANTPRGSSAPSQAVTYEPCVIDSAGKCTRWSHDHSPSVTE